MKRKGFNKKKKLALAAAILSAMEMSSGVSNMWLPMSNVAEAGVTYNGFVDGAKVYHANQDPNHPDIILSNKEVHEFEPDCEDGDNSMHCRQYPEAYYGIRAIWDKDIQKYVYVETDYDLSENPNFENANEEWYGHPETPELIGSAFTRKLLELNMQAATSETVKKTVTQEISSNTDITKIKTDVESKASKSDVDAVNNNLQSQIDTKIDKSDLNAVKNNLQNSIDKKADAAQSAAATDATNKANRAESNAKTYTDEIANGKANIGLDNINEDGKNVIREIAKNEVKNSGVNTTGDTVIISKPMETEGIHVNGSITTTGNIEVGQDIHVNGNAGIDKDLTVKGNTTVDKNLTVHGDERIDGKLTVGDKATFEKDVLIKGNQEVNGNTTIHGSETIDRDLHVKGNSETDGNSTVHGNSTVDGDFKVKGNTTLGDDKNNDVVDVNAKTNLHGDTTIGDSDKNKLTVNATSEFTANATFDKDVHIKGTLETDGNSVTHGNQITKGDSSVQGNESINGKLTVTGNGSFGNNLRVEGTTNTGNLVSRGDAVIGGNTHAYGDIVLNGQFFSKGAAQFGDNVSITKNLTVGGNTYVAGDAKVDGDIYGRSFNVGDERYIDKNGINANGHNVRNVADGQIGPNSLDAVNGRQLYTVTSGFERKLTGNINEVAAGAAAMANLHPLEYNQNNKVSVAAAAGSYKNQQAIAVGAFYRPDRKTLVSFSGSLGSNDNMFGVGVSKRLGQVSEIEGMTEEQLQDKVIKLNNDNKALKAKDAAFDKQLAEMAAKNTDLKKSLSDMSQAYDKLMSKVNSLATKLGELKAISQK